MKVLWFSGTPGLAKEYSRRKYLGAGWIDALQIQIERVDGCELGLVFYTDESTDNFVLNKTSYFPVRRQLNTKVKRLLGRVFSKVEYKENLENFLTIVRQFKPDIIHIH